jgi:hypothetical protein
MNVARQAWKSAQPTSQTPQLWPTMRSHENDRSGLTSTLQLPIHLVQPAVFVVVTPGPYGEAAAEIRQ